MNRYLLLIVTLISIGGCAVGSHESSNVPLAQITDISTGAAATRPFVAEVNGELALLYATKEDRVAFQLGKKPRQMLDDTARVKVGASYFKLWPYEQNIYATWWSHQSGKNIYLTSSVDGGQRFAPVSMVNDENGVLPPYSLTRAPSGILGMTYHDERLPNYQVFFNRSTDNGRTWPRPDQRLDTPPPERRSSDVHEPQTVQAEQAWVSAWTDNVQSAGKPSYRIVARRTTDAGQNWLPPEVLYTSDHHLSSLVVRATRNSIVIAADELNRGIVALTSLDSGVKWSAVGVLAGTSQASNSGIDMTLPGGRAHLVWMAQRSEEKTRIMVATLDVSQGTWLGAAKRIDPKLHENTLSLSPVVVATVQGELAAAWVDYRDIRPNIYLSASYDQGNNWTAPQPLLKPGEVSVGWPQLIPWRDQAAIAYERYPTDRATDGTLQIQSIQVSDAARALSSIPRFSQPSDAERKLKLEQRVNALWTYRLAGNYEPTYDMNDFAYKAATPKKMWLDSMGVITYLSYSVVDIAMTGNEANVNMKVKYELKPMILPSTGKPISVPPIEVETPTRWVWVGSDWYLVYAPSFEQPLLKY